MASADIRSFYDSDHARLRQGRDLGSDPSAMTGGNLVRGDLDLVVVRPATNQNPFDTYVVRALHRDNGSTFDPAVVAAQFHDSPDGVAVRANFAAGSLHYVLSHEVPARTI